MIIFMHRDLLNQFTSYKIFRLFQLIKEGEIMKTLPPHAFSFYSCSFSSTKHIQLFTRQKFIILKKYRGETSRRKYDEKKQIILVKLRQDRNDFSFPFLWTESNIH